MNKKDNDNICYTGSNSVKTGNYTKKSFLESMEKHYKKDCSVYVKSLKCKPCKKSKKLNAKEIKKQIAAEIKNKAYKISKKTEKKLADELRKCNQCKNNKTKKCNIENYMLYSGANFGKCEK